MYVDDCNCSENVSFNPLTAKCSQRQISAKFPHFIFKDFDKQIASCESTGRELSFEWSHHRISSADSKVRVALQNSIKYSGIEGVKMNSRFFNLCRVYPNLLKMASVVEFPWS